MRTLITLLFCIIAVPACFAQSEDRAEKITAAWSKWVDAGKTTASTFVTMRAGKIVSTASIGVAEQTPMPLASLSKAVTATCMLQVAKAASLSMDTRLGDLLDVPETVQGATLAQLITHTSGIWPDETQGNAALQSRNTDQTQYVFQQAVTRTAQLGQVGTFAYNNENYAILGAVIEKLTGQSYETACTDAVLTPLDIQTATLNGEWAAHGAWGGWSMSAADYATFAWAAFGPANPFGSDPAKLPTTSLNGGANYGVGALWREIRGRYLFWSSGMLCWDNTGDGGYFASYGGEWLVVALYADCLEGTERLADLDQALFDAAVK